ncbi:MAG: hypothetical protein ACFB15_11520 [Cyclobacteriaceae bacterium]
MRRDIQNILRLLFLALAILLMKTASGVDENSHQQLNPNTAGGAQTIVVSDTTSLNHKVLY